MFITETYDDYYIIKITCCVMYIGNNMFEVIPLFTKHEATNKPSFCITRLKKMNFLIQNNIDINKN